MDHIGQFLGKVLKDKKIDESVASAKVVDLFSDLSVSLLGPDVVRFITHVSFRDGVLQISAMHSAVLQEVQMKQSIILDALNEKSAEEVTALRFKIATQD